MRTKWNKETVKPQTNEHNESEYVLMLDKNTGAICSGWYNSITDKWHTEVYVSSSFNVSHWSEKPKIPQQR